MEDGGPQVVRGSSGAAPSAAILHPPSSIVASQRSSIFVRVAVATITLLALGRVVTNEFTGYDDPGTISNNPAFNPPTWRGVAKYWIAPEGALYAPLTYTTWGLLAFVARVDQPDDTGSMLNPWVYHAANLLIHLATTMIVLALLRCLTTSAFAAFVGATIFAIHPVQVETVAWASGTKDLLCGLFIATSLYAWVRHRQRERDAKWYAFAILAMLLACLSKPTGIVVAPMVLAIDRLVSRRPWRRSLWSLAPMFVMSILFAVVGAVVQPPVMAELPPLMARPLIATDALAFYLFKLAWPVNLSIDYGRLSRVAIERGWIYYTWIAPAGALLITWLARRALPLVATGAILALLGVAPILGIVPFTFQAYSTVADHYLYPSMIGIALVVAAVVARFGHPLLRASSLCIVLALAVRSFVAAGYWRDSASLFAHALDVNRHSFLALTGLGNDDLRRGRRDEARRHFGQAIDVNPNYAFAHLGLAELLLRNGDASGALAEYREVFRIHASQRNYDPRLASDSLVAVAARMFQRGHVSEAVEALEDATRGDPTNARAAQALESTRNSRARQPGATMP